MILTILLILYAISCVGLIFFVLLQNPKQPGLSASVSSGGDFFGGNGLEGGLVKLSAVFGSMFMLIALLIAYISK